MINKHKTLAKLQSLEKCLERMEQAVSGDVKSLDNLDNQDIFILNLQRAVQIIIDIGAHIIKDNKYGLPEYTRQYFLVLEEHNIISSDLAKKLSKMVGFRNIAVHDYEVINIDILKSIYSNNLNDFEDFKKQILASL